MAAPIHSFGDVAEEVEKRIRDAHIPVENYSRPAAVLIEKRFEHAREVARYDLAQPPLRLHVGVYAMYSERRGEAGDLRCLVDFEGDFAPDGQFIFAAASVVHEFHVRPPLPNRLAGSHRSVHDGEWGRDAPFGAPVKGLYGAAPDEESRDDSGGRGEFISRRTHPAPPSFREVSEIATGL